MALVTTHGALHGSRPRRPARTEGCPRHPACAVPVQNAWSGATGRTTTQSGLGAIVTRDGPNVVGPRAPYFGQGSTSHLRLRPALSVVVRDNCPGARRMNVTLPVGTPDRPDVCWRGAPNSP